MSVKKPMEFELEILENYFKEFIKNRVYFSTRTLAIEFLTDNTSLSYRQAPNSDRLHGMIVRFSRFTRKAKQEKLITKLNKRTYEIIKKVK